MSSMRVRPSARSDLAAGLSGSYRESADGLLFRAKMYRFMFLAAVFSALGGVVVYGAGMLDMSYPSYPGDLYSSFKWWFHVITLSAVMIGVGTAVVYMQQGGFWSRWFAIIGTLGAVGWLVFGAAVYGKILCECDNIGGAPPGFIHPECPDLTGDPRFAFVLRGWAHLGMLISMVLIAGIVIFVINNVGELIALLKKKVESPGDGEEDSSITSFIGARIASTDRDAFSDSNLLSKYSSPENVRFFATHFVTHQNKVDLEKQSIGHAIDPGYVLKR